MPTSVVIVISKTGFKISGVIFSDGHAMTLNVQKQRILYFSRLFNGIEILFEMFKRKNEKNNWSVIAVHDYIIIFKSV